MQLITILLLQQKVFPSLLSLKRRITYILDAKNLEGKMTLRSKAVIFGNLCNPMGTVWPQNKAEKGAKNARKS